MKRYIMLASLVLAISMAQGAIIEKEIDAAIERATLFYTGAQVFRIANFTAKKGQNMLIVKGITAEMIKQSVRVSGKGDFRILSVTNHVRYHDTLSLTQKAYELNQKMKLLTGKIVDLRHEILILTEKRDFLKLNNTLTGKDVNMPFSEFKLFTEYYNNSLQDVLNAIYRKENELGLLNDELNLTNRSFNYLTNTTITPTIDTHILIEANANITGELELSYFVQHAGWVPSYDIRVDNLTAPTEVILKASVFQNTGEDWNNVKLTFTNLDPATTDLYPELRIYYLPIKFGGTSSSYYKQGISDIAGLVLDKDTKATIPFAQITVVDKDGKMLSGTQADVFGNYQMMLPPKADKLLIKSLGYANTYVKAANANDVVYIERSTLKLQEVVITDYKQPSFQKDETQSSQVISRVNISNVPTGDVNSFSSNSAGVNQSSEGEMLSSRGGRIEPTYYSVDGMRVRGNAGVAETWGFNKDISKAGMVEQEFNAKAVNLEIEVAEIYTLESNKSMITISLKKDLIAPNYMYQTVPKLNPKAFLFVMIPDWETYNFINGEATLYFENTLVGKSYIDPLTQTDTLAISLGPDKNVVVSREKEKEYSKKQFIGKNITDNKAWKIVVKNNRSEDIHLVVYDQVPISTTDDIKVSDIKTSGAVHNETTGQLKYTLDIPAKQKIEKVLAYSVTSPKYMHLFVD